MTFGLDYVSGPPIANMKANSPPVTFVCRYVGYFSGYDDTQISTQQGKVLTPGEAVALSQHGIALVSNYEWYKNRALEDAGAGAWDANAADKIHRACGGPADRPIYFSVDVDTSGEACLAYFKGVASVLGLHRTGAYGSFRVLKDLFDAGAITWGWQTYAWSGGAWEPRAHIQQYENGVSMAGHSVDHNRSIKDDFGGWFSGAAPVPHTVPQTKEEPMTPLTLNDVKQYFKANSDGSWTRLDSKTGVALLDSLNKPIVLSGAIKDDWCNHGTDAIPDIGLPTGNATQPDAKNHPEIFEQEFERCTRRLDPKHVMDSPNGAGPVYSTHIENLYSAQTKLEMALDQLAATQKQLATFQAEVAAGKLPIGASPESPYIAAVKAVKGIVDPLEV